MGAIDRLDIVYLLIGIGYCDQKLADFVFKDPVFTQFDSVTEKYQLKR